MAGTNSAFSASEFRSAIQQAMVMGQPNETGQQVTFIWPEVDTYRPEDPTDNPYDWTQPATVVTAAKSYVQVNCAVQYDIGPVSGDAMGGFDASKATLTLLDVDYANVEGATRVEIGGILYEIDPPGAVPSGLFDVTIYTIHVSARA